VFETRIRESIDLKIEIHSSACIDDDSFQRHLADDLIPLVNSDHNLRAPRGNPQYCFLALKRRLALDILSAHFQLFSGLRSNALLSLETDRKEATKRRRSATSRRSHSAEISWL
jgi:hypothetical protein